VLKLREHRHNGLWGHLRLALRGRKRHCAVVMVLRCSNVDITTLAAVMVLRCSNVDITTLAAVMVLRCSNVDITTLAAVIWYCAVVMSILLHWQQ